MIARIRTAYKSAVTGRFVSRVFAMLNKATTYAMKIGKPR